MDALVDDGDQGPNTGGMGAYSPAPVLTPALEAEVMERIISTSHSGSPKRVLYSISIGPSAVSISPA
jgi:phosphoribosylamine-glycine ligase